MKEVDTMNLIFGLGLIVIGILQINTARVMNNNIKKTLKIRNHMSLWVFIYP
jgi:hypothetical protein